MLVSSFAFLVSLYCLTVYQGDGILEYSTLLKWHGVGSAEVRAVRVPLRLFLPRRDDEALNAGCLIVYARPRPLLRPAYQPCLHGIPMDVLYLCVVLLHGA
jgi:hypothetical protein